MEELKELLGTGGPLSLAGGIFLVLFGWLLYRLVLWAAGAVLGGAVGLGLGHLANQVGDWGRETDLIVIGAAIVIGAVIGFLIFNFLHKLAFFLAGAVIGGWGYAEVYRQLQQSGFGLAQTDVAFAFGIPVAAILAGLLLVWLDKWVIALASTAVGTLLIMSSLQWPYNGLPAIPIFALGLFIQIVVLRRSPKKPRNHEDDEEE